MSELELLAPARNADIGIAAIDCGADAVYIAGPEFGARQAAGNSMEDVRRLCEYAHRFGVRIFITLNTILYDNELPAAERLFKEAADAGVDAVIAQDLAVFALRASGKLTAAQAQVPEIHASTQCAIRTPEQARFYESLGASRLVLERQLSLEQIRAIREAVSCELEFFVHGALCVCYSGQCYMSEAIDRRSANRGCCIQACRSLYDLVDGDGKVLVKDKALLSLKDYNLIGRLKDLAECGVCSFKIEGRLKNASYVRNTVKAYSEALDRLVSEYPDRYRRASFGKSAGGFTPDLAKTFNRGYTELFLDGKRGKWSSMDTPKSVGEPIGTVSGIQVKASGAATVTVTPERPGLRLRNGDGFSFVSRDHNSIVGFRSDICEGATIKTRNVPELYVGARLFRNLDTAFEKEMEANLPERRIPVEVDLSVSYATERGGNYLIKVRAESQDGRTLSFDSEAGNEAAGNKERMEAMFRSQIGKAAGIYSFSLRELEVRTPDGSLPFLAASALNGIRREVAQRLDGIPCNRIPMGGPSAPRPAGEPVGPQEPKTVSYKANVANGMAEKIYRSLGAEKVEEAFELSHRKGAELMRTRYCIRHELGLCLKSSSVRQTHGGAGSGNGGLFLVNNGRRYRLGFDCAACEMTVSPVSES